MHRAKFPVTTLHRLALIFLAITAGWNLFALVTKLVDQWFSLERLRGVCLSAGIWSLFFWKVWTRPRSWGKGAGIAIILIVLFQVFLWHEGVKYFRSIGREVEFVPALLEFLPYEILLLTTGMVCLVLGMRSAPNEVVTGEELNQRQE